jgi:hypothetical protein
MRTKAELGWEIVEDNDEIPFVLALAACSLAAPIAKPQRLPMIALPQKLVAGAAEGWAFLPVLEERQLREWWTTLIQTNGHHIPLAAEPYSHFLTTAGITAWADAWQESRRNQPERRRTEAFNIYSAAMLEWERSRKMKSPAFRLHIHTLPLMEDSVRVYGSHVFMSANLREDSAASAEQLRAILWDAADHPA